jgi:hypothetical protein
MARDRVGVDANRTTAVATDHRLAGGHSNGLATPAQPADRHVRGRRHAGDDRFSDECVANTVQRANHASAVSGIAERFTKLCYKRRQHTPADHFAPSFADVALFVAVQTAVVLAAVRLGLLTILVAQFVSVLSTVLPIAIDSSVPYASSSRLIVLTVIAVAAYGWHTALAGRPMLGGFPVRHEPAHHA